jgi:hypothetical protein
VCIHRNVFGGTFTFGLDGLSFLQLRKISPNSNRAKDNFNTLNIYFTSNIFLT